MTHGLVYSMAESAQHLLAFLDCFQKGRDIVWALEDMRRGGINRGRYKPADGHKHPDNGFVCAAMEWSAGIPLSAPDHKKCIHGDGSWKNA